MKKLLLLVALVIVGVLVWRGVETPATQNNEETPSRPLTVGAVLPLSGPASFYGNDIQRALELAQETLAQQGTRVELVYADSHGLAKEGVAAYQQLKNTEEVDVILSALSRVSVPLVELADADQTPIMVTLVAAEGVAAKSPYAFRFFTQPKTIVETLFAETLAEKKYERIGVLHLNDEYGLSVLREIESRAQEQGIEVALTEGFEPRTQDFRSELTKMKSANLDALVFVPATETIAIVEQIKELGLEMDIIEGSINLSNGATREQLGALANGIYSTSYPSSLSDYGPGADFRSRFVERHNTPPQYVAPLAYDMLMLLGEVTEGAVYTADELVAAIKETGTYSSINGDVTIQGDGEINPPLVAVQIINGELVPVE